MLEKDIFCILYDTLNSLWHRTFFVAGFREKARFYSLRMGAGANLDDKPTFFALKFRFNELIFGRGSFRCYAQLCFISHHERF
jgi:hypothetical protein